MSLKPKKHSDKKKIQEKMQQKIIYFLVIL